MATIAAHPPVKAWRIGERAVYRRTLLCRVERVFPGLRHEDTRVKVRFTDEIDRIVVVDDLAPAPPRSEFSHHALLSHAA